jgi:hypothetical protein
MGRRPGTRGPRQCALTDALPANRTAKQAKRWLEPAESLAGAVRGMDAAAGAPMDGFTASPAATRQAPVPRIL